MLQLQPSDNQKIIPTPTPLRVTYLRDDHNK